VGSYKTGNTTLKYKKMNEKKFYIKLYVLIPVIYSGITIIGIILTYQLLNQHENNNQISSLGFVYLITAIGFLTFLISSLILRILLRPVMQFFNKAQKIPILKNSPLGKQKSIDDLDKITKVFDNVADILSHVEAKELFPDVIGSSASMRNIFTQIMKVAPTDSTVFITGESGTGKELIAASIYEHSARKGKPFIKINCVAIPEGLLESELFGHEKGSFTGATAQKKGKFEIADGGTLFLDEIGDMPLATQAKILRVLQEKEFERVGGTKPIRVDVRFIAATNKNLPKMIKEGFFREDLYFRLNVFSIFLPALRERREDIPLLANFFLSNFQKELKLTSAVLQLLIGYSWPGNIRELKNVLEQASVLAEKNIIESHHLPDVISRQGLIVIADNLNGDIALDDKLMIMEKEMIINALKMTGGIQVKAANILGINQRSLWHRIKKLNIDIDMVRNLQ
jgi:Transcriptional regulator containing GAF, AAA-type ATPase, and DNA binding domains